MSAIADSSDTAIRSQANEKSPPENGWSAKSIKTKEKLLRTATRIMVEKGIESVSVAAVARSAGVSRPGAYYHFKTRAELVQAVNNSANRLLVKTVAGAKEDEHLYSRAAELAVENQDLVFLRVNRMLEDGPADVIIRSRQRGIERLKREGHLQANFDVHIGAVILSTSIMAAYIAIKDAKSLKLRQARVKAFGETNYKILFFGALKEELYPKWPPLPTYKPNINHVKQFHTSVPTSDLRRAKSLETKGLLMKTTMKLISDKGEDAVSVSEVARRAGITRAGAYYHFKKKDELLDAVNEHLDKELLFTLDRSFAQREAFEEASDLSSENVSLLKLRLQKMLRSGANQDPLIIYYKKLFKWHHRHGHLENGIDPDIAAIICASASLTGLYLIISEVGTLEERARLAKKFRKTYRTFVFNGAFNSESKSDWPTPPSHD